MIYIGVNLTELNMGDGNIAHVIPEVKMEVDVNAKVDLDKLRDFKRKLEFYIDKNLNKCLEWKEEEHQ